MEKSKIDFNMDLVSILILMEDLMKVNSSMGFSMVKVNKLILYELMKVNSSKDNAMVKVN